jgi:general secretion pathway protein J
MIPRMHRVLPGFTLLELLIAMSLLAVLSLLFTDGLRFGLRVWERSAGQGRTVADTVAVYEFLEGRLARAVLLPADTDGTKPSLTGTSDWLSFVTVDADHAALAFPQRAELDCSNVSIAGSCQLRLLNLAGLPLRGVSDLRTKTTLFADVDRVALSYFGRRNRDNTAQWDHSWSNPDRLPMLVRMEINRNSADDLTWIFALPRGDSGRQM